MLVSHEQISDVFQNVGFAAFFIMLTTVANPVVFVVFVVVIVLNIGVTGLIVPWAPAFPPMIAVAVGFFAADEAESHATLTGDVIASLAELDGSLTMLGRALLPVFATHEAQESLSAIPSGGRFAFTNVLEHVLRIVIAIVLADHACEFICVEASAATQHQYAVLNKFPPRADVFTTSLGPVLRFVVSKQFDAPEIVLTVHASAGWRLVLNLLGHVVLDVI